MIDGVCFSSTHGNVIDKFLGEVEKYGINYFNVHDFKVSTKEHSDEKCPWNCGFIVHNCFLRSIKVEKTRCCIDFIKSFLPAKEYPKNPTVGDWYKLSHGKGSVTIRSWLYKK